MEYLNRPSILAGHQIKNRICMPPMVCFFGENREGFVNDRNISHYGKRAEAGTGLIVLEATCVRPEGRLSPVQLGIWDDAHIEGLSKISEECHRYGAVVTIQIHHGGYNTHPECGEPVSSSEYRIKERNSRALSVAEIKTLEKDFVMAAVRAKTAGFDGVQLHGCHGYLLNSFSSMTVNKRTDEYGGSAENRTRLACDIIRGIRSECGKDFIIDIRMAGNDPLPENGVENAEWYIQAGVDMLSVSSGIGSLDDISLPAEFAFGKITWLGVNIKEKYPHIPVAAVYGITTREQAEQLAGLVDFVSAGKAMLADSSWSEYALTGKALDTPCRSCRRCMWFIDPQKCPALLKK